MGVSSTAGPDRPEAGRRSIRSAFAARVAGPAVFLVLLWVAGAAYILVSTLSGRGYLRHHRNLAEIALAGAGTIVVLAVVMLAVSFARRFSREVSDLAATAHRLAERPSPPLDGQPRGGTHAAGQDDSPRPRSGGTHAAGPDDSPRSRKQAAEIVQAAAAITSLQRAAVAAVASEAALRDGLRAVFVSMARRNQSLLQRQLRLIDTLEQKASDPAALADLFSLDHLTTRMRRHAESLAILSGAAPGRAWREPVPVVDVIRGAMAEVEDYKRVSVMTASEDAVAGSAVADMIHLLAELMENATFFSPSGTRVEVRAGRVANGFAVEIDDRGLGIEPDQLDEINQQLASPPDFDLANSDRLGLFVGGKLAARHGVRVALRTSPYGGTTAIVLMPNAIVVPAAGLGGGTQPDALAPETRRTARRQAGLNGRGGDALALVGRRSAQASLPTADQPTPAPAPGNGPGPGPGNGPGPGPGNGAVPAPGNGAVPAPGNGAVPAPAGSAPAGPLPSRSAPAGSAPAGSAPAGSAPAGPLPSRSAARSFAPGGPVGSSQAGEQATTHQGLPRRTRQASLSPHLRDSPPTAVRPTGGDTSSTPVGPPEPEHARNLAASLQSGWQRGRQPDPADPPDAAKPATSAGQQESEAPQNEDG